MCGFKSFVLAVRFCRIYEEMHHFFRARSRRNEVVPLAWQRVLHVGRPRVLMSMLAVE